METRKRKAWEKYQEVENKKKHYEDKKDHLIVIFQFLKDLKQDINQKIENSHKAEKFARSQGGIKQKNSHEAEKYWQDLKQDMSRKIKESLGEINKI